ncbi:MAG: cobalamin-dependent protein [Deltaproteobacteria bacterium]|nr:cobalamin-dependent protein [Deltaproteobacteria bacterium]
MSKPNKSKRILLSGVFGPFGVDDAYGRKENIMELFHNQVTKGQGSASFRFFHRSFGLYFIAANIDADVTVLDFPSKARFEEELKKGYDVVGISFIAPNFIKAREMARLTRIHAPDATIIVGGHGTAIEGIEERIDCDHVARGEGIRWMREFLGQDPDAPLVHPALPSAESEMINGIPVPGVCASILVPGVGCVNGCKFCSTSHFFERAYTPFIATGKALFEVACKIADERGTDAFFVMDENFLKDKARALELLDEMERHQRFFSFHIFSSAETIAAIGVDTLVRLGITFLWIGVESSSPQGNFEKNAGLDARKLVQQLRDRGIIVLASGILCQEHHTEENIQKDIDFMTGLEADMVQFMLLIPLPVTPLYREYKLAGRLLLDMPFEEWHGQKLLNFTHPHFPGDAAERWIKRAFRQDYELNSSTLYRVTETSLRGYKRLAALTERDTCLEARMGQLAKRARQYGNTLPALARLGVNDREKARARALDLELTEAMGTPGWVDRIKRKGAIALVARWRLRVRLFGDSIQPKTIVSHFAGKQDVGKSKVRSFEIPQLLKVLESLHGIRVAARGTLG